ncbi:protein RD3-like [Carcharodon carcharias]|uniref:protein RD3-like n=1 Tax=Carcharodon carcharias TaxID=13397 RepID=UPI001B7F1E72|nr:protein RD3-like [Carcharodon carcharias]
MMTDLDKVDEEKLFPLTGHRFMVLGKRARHSLLAMFFSSIFHLNDRHLGLTPPTEEELVTNTLTLELSSQLKRAEKMHRERLAEWKRAKQGVDYSWLMAQPRHGYQISPQEQLELEELCSKIKPSQCGPFILRFRRLVQEFESEAPEIPRVFRLALLDFIEQEEEEEARQILRRQAMGERRNSLSILTWRCRLKINPFQREDHMQEAALGLPVTRRAKSLPEFNVRGDN